MKKLRMLYLYGNPFTLLRGYVELIKAELPNIKYLDGKLTKVEKDLNQDQEIRTYADLLKQQSRTIEIANNPEAAKGMDNKDAQSKSEIMSSKSSKNETYGRRLTGLMNKRLDDLAGDFSRDGGDLKFNITLSVRTLEGIKSVNLDEGISGIEEEGTEKPIEKSQSLFWFEFDLFGHKFSSKDEKIPHTKTMKMENSDLHILDFAFSKNYNFDLTAELYRNIMKGFHVEVYQSQPKREEPKEDSPENEEPQVIVNEELLGYGIVSLDDFITNPSMTTSRKKLS